MDQYILIGLLAPILLTVVTAIGTALGWVVRNYILRKKSSAEIGLILQIAGLAVRAAEQLGLDNSDKLDKATDIAQKYLDAYGVKVSAKQLRAALESAVLTELLKEPSPVPVSLVPDPTAEPQPVTEVPAPAVLTETATSNVEVVGVQ